MNGLLLIVISKEGGELLDVFTNLYLLTLLSLGEFEMIISGHVDVLIDCLIGVEIGGTSSVSFLVSGFGEILADDDVDGDTVLL
jgi:hypothetical protein